MRNFFLILFFASQFISAQDIVVKSLQTYLNNNEELAPIIDYNQEYEQRITINFDVATQNSPNLIIVFKFCNQNWEPYNNIFLTDPSYDTEYNLWLYELPSNVKEARYHYSGQFPNENVRFSFSGKWKFFIMESYNRDNIIAEGKFVVVHKSKIRLRPSITRSRAENEMPGNSELGRTFILKTDFVLPDSLYPNLVKGMEIIENRKIEYPYIINRDFNTENKFVDWNGSNRFSFLIRDLKPGNNYRTLNLRNKSKYQYPSGDAQFGGIETSNFYKFIRDDNQGASIIDHYNSDDAQYLNIRFRIRPPEEVTAPIFLVGSFNNWVVSPEYEMYDKDGLLSLIVQLKRGIYDYQYVTAEYKNDKISNIDWNVLEGNFWETDNIYNIFLYYRNPDKGGFEEIIAYKKISSRGT